MSAEDMHEAPRCQHVRLSGRQCRAPAKRGQNYCLFHEHEHDTSPNLTFPPVEDAASVQVAADQVLQALRDNTIEFQRASLMFSGLRLMRANLKRLGLEMNDEIENPTQAKEAWVGHPQNSVGHPATKEEREEARLASMPSLAEMLLQGLDVKLDDPQVVKAKAEGKLGELLIEKLELVEPKELTTEDTEEHSESGHPSIGPSGQQDDQAMTG